MPSKAMNLSKDKELEEMKAIEKDVKDLKKDLDTRLVELGKQVDDLQKKAAKTVTERPLLALGVAFAVGMAFGIALSRSSD
jgi:ElaB/YqjD/DUF883 family membrane-anchored ribosome-binding protein